MGKIDILDITSTARIKIISLYIGGRKYTLRHPLAFMLFDGEPCPRRLGEVDLELLSGYS
jgi:hypothetical protein